MAKSLSTSTTSTLRTTKKKTNQGSSPQSRYTKKGQTKKAYRGQGR